MRKERTLVWVIPCLAGLVYLWRAWPSLWSTVDDAWISGRYAAHLAAGQGLVYNAGEPAVEGYTNLVWTVWLAVGIAVGADLNTWMVVSGLILGVGTVVSVAGLSRALGGEATPWWVPGAVSFFVAMDVHHAVVSTNGLETSMFLFCATAVAWAVMVARQRALWILGPALGLLAGIRPEGLFVGLVLGVVALVTKRHERRDLLVMFFGLLGTWLALEAWRLGTYGAWLPNTFSAKANGGLSKHIQANLRHLRHDQNWWWGLLIAYTGAVGLGWRDVRRLGVAVVAAGLVLVAFRVQMWMPAGRLLMLSSIWVVALVGAGASTRIGQGLLGILLLAGLAAPWSSIEKHVRWMDQRHSVVLPNGASSAAAHLGNHLPPGEWMAVRDAGVLAHFVGTEVKVAELHHRALTQPHPEGLDTNISLFTPLNPGVIVLTQAREDASKVRYSRDKRVFSRSTAEYDYLGRVYQHHHRYYDLYARRDLSVPELPPEGVLNHAGPSHRPRPVIPP